MTHLTARELAAWRDTPSESDRARIVGHLAACDECTARYAEMIRARAPESAPSHFEPEAFVSHGYAAMEARRGKRLAFRPAVLVALAAAAAIALAVWLPRAPGTRPDGGGDTMRGAGVQAVAPAGDVSGAVEFRWTSPVSADRYAVEVKDAAGRRVFYRETRDERMPADAALDAALRPGVRFTWTVTALDGSGEPVAQSPPREFTRSAASLR